MEGSAHRPPALQEQHQAVAAEHLPVVPQQSGGACNPAWRRVVGSRLRSGTASSDKRDGCRTHRVQDSDGGRVVHHAAAANGAAADVEACTHEDGAVLIPAHRHRAYPRHAPITIRLGVCIIYRRKNCLVNSELSGNYQDLRNPAQLMQVGAGNRKGIKIDVGRLQTTGTFRDAAG